MNIGEVNTFVNWTVVLSIVVGIGITLIKQGILGLHIRHSITRR